MMVLALAWRRFLTEEDAEEAQWNEAAPCELAPAGAGRQAR
ncbi:hypothetical protein QWZ10_18010 [Paracoccus cavernae]|uniref:Uncharacterized protein n=1 Tax=Paracoccus cavernae TaxID=1571207 RepID=A0ABT8D8P9_9RHOB|nr:hypothetical protein [Paracoccus cavernae]